MGHSDFWHAYTRAETPMSNSAPATVVHWYQWRWQRQQRLWRMTDNSWLRKPIFNLILYIAFYDQFSIQFAEVAGFTTYLDKFKGIRFRRFT